MGVHGLWDLLAPVGRRVSVDTLAGKKLAIGLPSPNPTNSLGFVLIPFSFFFLKFFGGGFGADASIWMIQFMKAMRDEKGEVVRNAHLLGFFRRICKLLFLRTKPVFVFDGGTPALKRRTVIARRRHRENAKAKIRKTAEKLLLNHVRSLFFFSRFFWIVICECLCANLRCHGNACFSFVFVYIYWCVLLISLASGVATTNVVRHHGIRLS